MANYNGNSGYNPGAPAPAPKRKMSTKKKALLFTFIGVGVVIYIVAMILVINYVLPSGDFKIEYETNSGGGITITAVRDESKKERAYTVPAELDGLPVTVIGNGTAAVTKSAAYVNHVPELILPESVTEIAAGAFKNTGLKKINLTHVTHIGAEAFENCKLSAADFSGVEIIGGGAFSGNSFTTLSLSGTMTIGSTAFKDCKQLESVTAFGFEAIP